MGPITPPSLLLPRAPRLPAAPPVVPTGLQLRLIAGFCPTRAEALRLHAGLCNHLRLGPAQALLLAPAELGSPRLVQCLQRWQGLRLAETWAAPAAPAADAGPGAGRGVLRDLLRGMFRSLARVLHAGVRAPTGRGPLPPPFDVAVQQRLAEGLHAVVVQQPQGQYTCNYLVETMREDAACWCAETAHQQA